MSISQYQPGDKLLVHLDTPRLYTDADGPNPKLISPWRGPIPARSQLSPVNYRVARDRQLAEASVDIGRIKAYCDDASSSVPDFTALDGLFSGISVPGPDLDGCVLTVHIDRYAIEAIKSHKRGPGKASLKKFQIIVFVKDKPHPIWIFGDASTLCLIAMR